MKAEYVCKNCGRDFLNFPCRNSQFCTRRCATTFSRMDPLDQVLSKTIINDLEKCWIWTGYTTHGYGQFSPSDSPKQMKVHRFMYEHFLGPIPEGLQIDHLCRVTNCVNPSHLEPVTNRENLLRGTGFPAINSKKTHCHRGHILCGDNLNINPSGSRRCRACSALNQRRYRKESKNDNR